MHQVEGNVTLAALCLKTAKIEGTWGTMVHSLLLNYRLHYNLSNTSFVWAFGAKKLTNADILLFQLNFSDRK